MANYICTSSEITSLADAIRTKGGTSASLTWPSGFISAISTISTSGQENEIITRKISGTYINSTVSEVRAYAFAYCDNLEGISMQNCTEIYSWAFINCSQLSDINLPNLVSVGYECFQYCAALTSINFPKVQRLGRGCFAYCRNITSVSLPLLTYTSNPQMYGTFQGCSKLSNFYAPQLLIIDSYYFANCAFTEINWPHITYVSGSAFQRCTSLTRVEMSSCAYIGDYAFSSCTNLSYASFKVASSVNRAFHYLTKLEYVYIPSVTILSSSNFYGCTKLNTVILASCSKFSGMIFGRCYNLLSLYILSTGVASLSGAVFSSTPISNYTTSTGGIYGSIYVRASLLTSYQTAANWSVYSARMVGLTDAQVAEILGT